MNLYVRAPPTDQPPVLEDPVELGVRIMRGRECSETGKALWLSLTIFYERSRFWSEGMNHLRQLLEPCAALQSCKLNALTCYFAHFIFFSCWLSNVKVISLCFSILISSQSRDWSFVLVVLIRYESKPAHRFEFCFYLLCLTPPGLQLKK